MWNFFFCFIDVVRGPRTISTKLLEIVGVGFKNVYFLHIPYLSKLECLQWHNLVEMCLVFPYHGPLQFICQMIGHSAYLRGQVWPNIAKLSVSNLLQGYFDDNTCEESLNMSILKSGLTKFIKWAWLGSTHEIWSDLASQMSQHFTSV